MIVDLNEIRLNYVNEVDNINFFCCLTTKSPVIVLSNKVIVIITASLLQAMGSTGAFRSGYCFRVTWFPQALADLPCIAGFDVSVSKFLIVGIHACSISAPLSLFMLFGLSLM